MQRKQMHVNNLLLSLQLEVKAGTITTLTSVTMVLRFSLKVQPSLQEDRCVLLVKMDRSMEILHVSALLFQSASNFTHLLNAPRDPVRGTVRSRTCCSEKAHFSWRPAVLHQWSGVYPKNTTPISTNASRKIGKDPKREILFWYNPKSPACCRSSSKLDIFMRVGGSGFYSKPCFIIRSVVDTSVWTFGVVYRRYFRVSHAWAFKGLRRWSYKTLRTCSKFLCVSHVRSDLRCLKPV